MSRFIELHRDDDRPMLVNLDDIAMVRPGVSTNDRGEDEPCAILEWMSSPDTMMPVSETYLEVRALIWQAERRS
jgi:hypothetical protein